MAYPNNRNRSSGANQNMNFNFNQGNNLANNQQDFYDNEDRLIEMTPTYAYEEFWLTPGPYAGVGPASYAPSDELIRENIAQRMTYNGDLNASDINVDVEDGVAHLTGTVSSRQQKRLAEDVADSVLGVIDVENDLKIVSQQDRQKFQQQNPARLEQQTQKSQQKKTQKQTQQAG